MTTHDDRNPTVTVKRVERGGDGVTTWIIDCPHCGEEHTHGASAGHRVAHCLGGRGYYLTRRGWPFPAEESTRARRKSSRASA